MTRDRKEQRTKIWVADPGMLSLNHTLCPLSSSPHQGLPIPECTSLVDLKIKSLGSKFDHTWEGQIYGPEGTQLGVGWVGGDGEIRGVYLRPTYHPTCGYDTCDRHCQRLPL